jgi:hypothetical protein
MFNALDKIFLLAASVSILLSAFLMLFVSQIYGIFVGLWVPSILSLWVGLKICMMNKNN